MQDAECQNFGCLNDEELEFMLRYPDDISLLVLHSCVFLIV